MGIFRIFLAASVLNGHLPVHSEELFLNAGVAVMCFFVVSGFYMALVINEQYALQPRWRRRFALNRFLRLYPGYLAALALVGVINVTVHSQLLPGWQGGALLPLLNFTIVGQDWFMLARDHGVLNVGNPVLIQPAWSIAAELTLYLLAALCFRGHKAILATLTAGILAWFIADAAGLAGPDFDMRFTPKIAPVFTLGAVGWVAYTLVRDLPVKLLAAGAVATGGALVWHRLSGLHSQADLLWLYVLLAAACPFIFALTRHSSLDRMLGDLSYPLYLVHHPIILAAIASGLLGASLVATSAIASVAAAVVIVLAIERPVERLRRLIRSGRDKPKADINAPGVVRTG